MGILPGRSKAHIRNHQIIAIEQRSGAAQVSALLVRGRRVKIAAGADLARPIAFRPDRALADADRQGRADPSPGMKM
jgi:hypothetical protein